MRKGGSLKFSGLCILAFFIFVSPAANSAIIIPGGDFIPLDEILINLEFIAYDQHVPVVLYDQEVEIHLRVLYNRLAPGEDSAFLMHGFAHNGNILHCLQRVMLDTGFNDSLCRVFVMDLPGHGQSTFPNVGRNFGELSLEDYREAVLQVMAWIYSNYGDISVVGGHSMGTLVTQMLQQYLISQSTSLEQEFSTRGLFFLAPALPANIEWWFAHNGLLEALLPFISWNFQLGLHLDIDCQGYLEYFYTERWMASPVPSAPSCATIEGFRSAEPLAAGLQVAFVRPYIDPGIFSGYNLVTVSYASDVLFYPDEHEVLHNHLMGEPSFGFFIEVGDAVHNGFQLDPEELGYYMQFLFD